MNVWEHMELSLQINTGSLKSHLKNHRYQVIQTLSLREKHNSTIQGPVQHLIDDGLADNLLRAVGIAQRAQRLVVVDVSRAAA